MLARPISPPGTLTCITPRMCNVHTCISAAPTILCDAAGANSHHGRLHHQPHSATGSTSPQTPTCASHLPALLVPHPQMSKPSQRTKDCRPVGRSGNRLDRPRATSRSFGAVCTAKELATSAFSFSASTLWLLSFCSLFLHVPVRSCTEPGSAGRPGVGALDATGSRCIRDIRPIQ